MAEGIKSLATTAGYFAPGAGIADALGLYPTDEGMGASILQNIRQGNLGQAGFQGLGVLGDLSYVIPGIGIALGTGLKTVSKVGKAGTAGKKLANFARGIRDKAMNFNRIDAPAPTRYNPDTLKAMTPQDLATHLNPQRIEKSTDILTDYATKNKSIAGFKPEDILQGKSGKSNYLYIEKNVGLGADNPAKIAVRVSDHAPTLKGAETRGGRKFIDADVRINVAPGTSNATTLEEALHIVDNIHIKPGNIDNILTEGSKVSTKHLGVPRVVNGKVVTIAPPRHWKRGGKLPFGIPEAQLP